MESQSLPNTLAYYDTATITAVKSFIVQAPVWHNLFYLTFVIVKIAIIAMGSAKANGREPKSCLGRVFNFKLGPFVYI